MANRVHRESTWPRRATTAETSDRQDNRIDATQGARPLPSSGNGTPSGSTTTIFDFHMPDVSRQEVNDLYRRAEYLLDEMEMGAADRGAVNGSAPDHQRNGNDLEPFSPAEPEVASHPSHTAASTAPALSNPTESRSRILPEAALPSIRSRPQPPSLRNGPTEAPLTSSSTSPTDSVMAPGTLHPTITGTTAANRPTPGQSAAAQGSVLDPVLSSSPNGTGRRLAVRPVVSVSEQKVRELEVEIDQIYAQVNRLQAKRRDVTGHALSLLRESRVILQTQPERYGRAEYNVRQVRMILERARESHRRSLRYGVLLLVYLALWLTVCAGAGTLLYLYGVDIQIILIEVLGDGSRLAAHAMPLIWTLLAGGAGGVLGAAASLIVQMRQGQEFDRQYAVRYTIQPVMGVVLALATYFLCDLVFNAAEVDLTAEVVTSAIPAFLAFAAGLWQEMVYGLLYRLTGIFRLSSSRRR